MDTQPWTILLIDDDEDDYFITRTLLGEAQGRTFRLEWAGSFAEGRRALGLGGNHHHPPKQADGYHAVLVDYDLGLDSGIALIREAAQAGYPAPLILFTGRGSYAVDLEAMQAGATLYLTKDEANPLLLERAIRYAVEIKQKAARLERHEQDLLRSEVQLKVREALLASVIESAQGAVWAVDRDCRLTMANAEFQREAEEALGRDIPLGESMLADWVTQHNTDLWRALYDRALSGEAVRYELDSPTPDGKVVYREFFFHPIRGEDGLVTGAACFARDITPIRAAEVELADFLESTHDSFFALDADWRIIYANRRWAEVLGRDPAELVGQNFWSAFPRYTGTDIERRYRAAMEQRAPAHFEAGGVYSQQWYDISIYPTRSGISVFASDISREKQASSALRQREAELSRSESRYRTFFENLRDLVQVLELVYDAQGAPVDWIWRDANPPALQLLGLTRAELIGSRGTLRLDPEFVRGLLPSYDRVVKTGEPLEYEINFAGRDYLVSVFRMEENQIGSSAADITGRKQAERQLKERNAALRQSEARLRRLFETSIIAIMTRDVAGHIYDVNDAFLNLLGYTREAFFAQPRTINDLIPPEYHPVEEQIVAEVMATGASKPHEKQFIRADGGQIPVLVGHTLLGEKRDLTPNLTPPAHGSASEPPPLHGEGGQETEGEPKVGGGPEVGGIGLDGGEIIGFVVDLTDLKVAQQALEEYAEKLKRSNHELEQFAFIASHDLQEPLRKIQSFGELIQRDLRGKLTGSTADYLERMTAAAQRMQEMIRDLLELSRVNTRGQPFEPVDLNETAAVVLEDLERLIERTQGEVQVGPLPTIEADPTQMRQLLQNLIGNALKFHKPGEPPRVVVSALPPDGRDAQRGRGTGPLRHPASVALVVEDNGIGFEKEYFERILEPFQRLHGRSEYEGTGIGLAICKQIVTRHHGEITAESAPGEGAQFVITLPVMQEGE